ncbi:MAG: hypothetical protein KBD67_05840 [Anaerolineaceae bacterium]|nr:hypothetical protein [Anaerolineaceae bacterium]
MTLASFFLGTVIASIIGCAFHFWHGGGLKWLIFFNVLAWIGFWLGHVAGNVFNLKFLMLGPINFGAAAISTLIVLFLGFWLSMFKQEAKRK